MTPRIGMTARLARVGLAKSTDGLVPEYQEQMGRESQVACAILDRLRLSKPRKAKLEPLVDAVWNCAASRSNVELGSFR